jgi:hypothetical protein
MPWVRFARGSGDWVRFVEALHLAVGSFRRQAETRREGQQPARHGFGEPVAHEIGSAGGFSCRALPEYHWVRFVAAVEIGFVRGTEHRDGRSFFRDGLGELMAPETAL